MNEREVQEQVQSLRVALEQARAKLMEQQEVLEQLTSPPFAYATVVAVTGTPAERVDFTKAGTRVRIRRDSQFAHQNSGVGSIIGIARKGWVHIKFDDRSRNEYRTGERVVDDEQCDGTCDLELADPQQVGTAVIVIEGKFLEVPLPKDRAVAPGDTVTVVAQTMQIIGVASAQIGGPIGYLRRVIDETFVEVDHESSVRVVFSGKFGASLEKGDRVVLDGSASVVVRNLGKDDERFRYTATTTVTWDDIGGLVDAKQLMIEAIELPHREPDLFRYYGKRPVKGILLYGPPRCGKTMLGKATATALARIAGGSAAAGGFLYVKGPEILDRFVGVAEATVRQLFQRARKHQATHGYPAVIFIDEADAILYKRGTGVSSDVERTIVPMFLAEMDGMEESGAIVILATNRPDVLDPAVVGDGRIDRKVKVARPTPTSAVEIFRLNLGRVPLHNGYSHGELATLGSDQVFASHRVLYQITTRSRGECAFTLGSIVNGGMIASIVDQATSLALQRDLASKKRRGLRKEDLVAAVDAVERQNRDLNHTDELAEFVHDFREDVVGIARLRRAAA